MFSTNEISQKQLVSSFYKDLLHQFRIDIEVGNGYIKMMEAFKIFFG